MVYGVFPSPLFSVFFCFLFFVFFIWKDSTSDLTSFNGWSFGTIYFCDDICGKKTNLLLWEKKIARIESKAVCVSFIPLKSLTFRGSKFYARQKEERLFPPCDPYTPTVPWTDHDILYYTHILTVTIFLVVSRTFLIPRTANNLKHWTRIKIKINAFKKGVSSYFGRFLILWFYITSSSFSPIDPCYFLITRLQFTS